MEATTVTNAAADEPWLVLMQRGEDLKKMTRAQLISHLTILGWVPVEGKREALQNGVHRVNIVERDRGLSAAHYRHYTTLERVEVPWDSINDARLRMLAQRILEQEYRDA